MSYNGTQRQLKDVAAGGVVKNLNIERAKATLIPLPPKSLQREIVAEISVVERRDQEGQTRVCLAQNSIEAILTSYNINKPLADICSISKSKFDPQSSEVETINYIGLENIESHTAKLVDFAPTLTTNIKSTKNVFRKGEVLYGKLRPYLNKVWIAEFDGICSTDILSSASRATHRFETYFAEQGFCESVVFPDERSKPSKASDEKLSDAQSPLS